MPSKRVLLAVASYLDSSHVPLGVERAEARTVVERLLAACEEQLGKPPKDLDGHDAQVLLTELLPAWFDARDPLAELLPDVLRGYLDHLEETELVAQSFELRHGVEGSLGAFLGAVRSGSGRRSVAPRQATVEHHADKLGRNEPCFCGSGKKFKKCCGKGA